MPIFTRTSAALVPYLLTSLLAFGQRGANQTVQPPTVPALADIVAKNSRSIVRVTATFTAQVHREGGPVQTVAPTSGGTGFIVDTAGHVATARHVVDLAINQTLLVNSLPAGVTLVPGSFQAVSIGITVPAENTKSDQWGNLIYNVNQSFSATTFRQNALFDIAILAGSKNLLEPMTGTIVNGKPLIQSRTMPTFQEGDAPRSGDAISVSGYPAVIGFQEGIPGLTTNTGIISNPFFVDRQGRSLYLADLHSNHGDSGGPVFSNTDGHILGFADAYYPAMNGENSGLTAIVPIGQILTLLRSPDGVVVER
jgi:S1-C subfamily serine protease